MKRDNNYVLDIIVRAQDKGYEIKNYVSLENYVVIMKDNQYFIGFFTDNLPEDTYKRICCMLEK